MTLAEKTLWFLVILSGLGALAMYMGYLNYRAIPEIRVSQHHHIMGYQDYQQFTERNP